MLSFKIKFKNKTFHIKKKDVGGKSSSTVSATVKNYVKKEIHVTSEKNY